MLRIGMIGSHLIHTFGYAMHFNRADVAAVDRHEAIPSWQADLVKAHPDVSLVDGARLTHVAGEPANVAAAMADVFGAQVADSVDAVIEACDIVMVMDENIVSRTELAERSLRAGRATFVDKLPGDAARLVELARQKGVRLGAWSQVGHAGELDAIAALPAGGIALVGFHLTRDIFAKYVIHAVNALQAALPGRITDVQPLSDNGNDRMWLLLNEHGGRIVFAVGPTIPPSGIARVDYAVGGQAALAQTLDRNVMFARAVRDVAKLAGDEPTRFGDDHIIEAASLIERLG